MPERTCTDTTSRPHLNNHPYALQPMPYSLGPPDTQPSLGTSPLQPYTHPYCPGTHTLKNTTPWDHPLEPLNLEDMELNKKTQRLLTLLWLGLYLELVGMLNEMMVGIQQALSKGKVSLLLSLYKRKVWETHPTLKKRKGPTITRKVVSSWLVLK